MSKALTAAALKRYRPGKQPRWFKDTIKGLYAVLYPTGQWSAVLRLRSGKKVSKVVLGHLLLDGKGTADAPVIGQPITLHDAHVLATEALRQREMGTDPIAERRARKRRQRSEREERHAGTFAACVRSYIDEHAKPKTRNWREVAKLLGLHYPLDGGEPEETKGGLLQRWADKPIRDIDGHDIWEVIDEARKIGVPGLEARNPGKSDARARGLFVALSSFFTWAQRHRLVEINPCRTVPRPAAATQRERILASDEIRWFWEATDSADAPRVPGAPKPFAVLLKLLLLTGARRDEVAGMTRAELSDDGASWHLLGSRTKNKKPHVVPLPEMVRDLISVPSESDLVFTTNGRTPVSGWSRMKRRLDAAMLALAKQERGGKVTIPPWRLHDLRRTAVTGMAELGVQPHVIELVVNHISGHKAGIAGVYNKSELMPERKAALERWAAHLEGLVSGRSAKVVTLPKKGKARRAKG